MLSIDFDLQCVLDLREPSVLEHLGLKIGQLIEPWKLAQAEARPVLTQRIGSAARAVELEALLVPSARIETGCTLVVFPDRLRIGSTIDLYVGDEPTVPRYGLQGRFEPRNPD